MVHLFHRNRERLRDHGISKCLRILQLGTASRSGTALAAKKGAFGGLLWWPSRAQRCRRQHLKQAKSEITKTWRRASIPFEPWRKAVIFPYKERIILGSARLRAEISK